MGHREDLLAGAVRCLREKGYAHTTARDIVAASGTNLASIGYHYGSTKALLNAAVLAAMDDFGAEMARAIGEPDPGPSALEPSALERFERFWTRVIDSFQASSQVWLATFDIFTVAQRDPEVRAAVAEGLEDGRKLWARLLYGVDDADEEKTRAIGSLHQALVSGVLVQWLIDPGRAPSAAELARGLQAIADQVARLTKPAQLARPSERSSAWPRRSPRRTPTGSAGRWCPAAPWAGHAGTGTRPWSRPGGSRTRSTPSPGG